ncbi:MAG: UDP-N-acetylmuramate--L-alanine ligase [Clostridiales bacterium]|jgi:UDP-N-acetylmuramate--alanine ligase|nr:UDP-N-acetylmuramate--L-alanine ligase [Clostridiales bacterium]
MNHVHFIGIGGVSMSGLAQILLNNGVEVSGSDRQNSPTIEILRNLGAAIYINHAESNINNPDLVVYTAAIHNDNEELMAARAKGIPTITRAEFLGKLMGEYETSIAIAGTHGKTTTTGMIASVFMACANPTVLLGGNMSSMNGNVRIGDKKQIIVEACEYCDSFLEFNPSVSLITNVEADHLDYFDDLDDIIESFHQFMAQSGRVVVNADDANAMRASEGIECVKYSVDYSDSTISSTNDRADYIAKNIRNIQGKTRYEAWHKCIKLCDVELSVRGLHNVSNSIGALAVCHSCGVAVTDIIKGLAAFKGTERRFEYKGSLNGIDLYDDYAHHPTEIKTTIATAQELPNKNVWYIFQSHTYTRTLKLKDEFIEVLSPLKNLIIADIYAAREEPIDGVSGKDMAEWCGAKYLGDFDAIAAYLLENAKPGDAIITVGAGDAVDIIDKILLKE